MYVLADLEWVTNYSGIVYPSQLAALRVDAQWKVVSAFYTRMCPPDDSFCIDHVGYRGGKYRDFLKAPSVADGMDLWRQWLQKEDVICWWYEEAGEVLRRFMPQPHYAEVILSQYTPCFPVAQRYARANPYILAEHYGLTAVGKRHDSRNDVMMMLRVLEHFQVSQECLANPPISAAEGQVSSPEQGCYVAEDFKKLIHKCDCGQIRQFGERKELSSLKRAIGQGYKPCDCCKTEYRKALKERNQSIIHRCQYNYLFAPNSQIFHTRDCGLALFAHSISGVQHYSKAIKRRSPCRVCNPGPEHEQAWEKPSRDDRFPNFVQPMPSPKKKKKQLPQRKGLTEEQKKAIRRQQDAREERQSYAEKGLLEREGKDDLYTLTKPSYGFWAATGYKTFHLRRCNKLKGLQDLRGFATFQAARSAGFAPCKLCKPTSKHDVTVSIPITSRARKGETVEVLIQACQAESYSYQDEGAVFTLETPVGRWRIHITSAPYTLEHINLVITPKNRTIFHTQPRMFHSLQDVVDYIRRHDSALQKKRSKLSV